MSSEHAWPAPAGTMAQANAGEAALDWLVVMRSGEVTAHEQQAFERWVRDPAHAQAWARLVGAIDAPFASVRTHRPDASAAANSQADWVARALVRAQAATRRRRQLLKGALSIAGLGSATTLALAQRDVSVGQWLVADHVTRTGERRALTLPDGSRLHLNARSAIDVDYTAQQRLVLLREGALIAEIAPATGLPPFLVRTGQGTVRPIGTRVSVRQDEGSTWIAMLAQRAVLTPAAGQALTLEQGMTARMTRDRVTLLDGPATGADDWLHGVVQLHDQPLDDLLAALRPYHRGYLRASPAAQALRVYGSYPLDDPQRTLDILQDTLPLQVQRQAGGWLVRIDIRHTI